MTKAELYGVTVTPLAIIPGEHGQVMHMLKASAPAFRKFGEIYFSGVYPGVVKGWKLHTASWSNLCVPVGRIKFVLHDLRQESPTNGEYQEVFLGDNRYALLTIPPGIAYAWKNLSPDTSLIANCASEEWSSEESKNLAFEDIEYKW